MAVYKYVSDKLIRYLNEMYGIINVDKVPAKIVTKEFECNGFVKDGEEVDGMVNIPKDLIVFSSVNGTSISKNAKNKSKTDNNYRYLGFVTKDGKTVTAPSSGEKGSVIKESDFISKCNICGIVNNLNQNIISFNIFKKPSNNFVTEKESEKLNFNDIESLDRANKGYKVYGKYTVDGLKTLSSLNGYSFYVIYPNSDRHKFLQENSKRYYIVTPDDAQATGLSGIGTIFVHDENGIQTAGRKAEDIEGRSVVFIDIKNVEKLASNVAAGTNEYLFMGASEVVKDLAADLKNIAGCSSDETGIPLKVGSGMSNIFACKIGAMFNSWFNKNSDKMSSSGDAKNFKYQFNNDKGTIDLESLNKEIENIIPDDIESMSQEEFNKMNESIANKCNVKPYSKEIQKSSTNVKIKSGLYELIKESGRRDKWFKNIENKINSNSLSDADKKEINRLIGQWKEALTSNDKAESTAAKKNLEHLKQLNLYNNDKADSVPPIAADVINDKENTQPTTANSAQQNVETNNAEEKPEEKKSTTSIYISREEMLNYYKEQVKKKIEEQIKLLNDRFTEFDKCLDENNAKYKDDLDVIDKDIKSVYTAIKGLFYYDSKKQADIKSKATLQGIYKTLLQTFDGDIYKSIVVKTLYNDFSKNFNSIFSDDLRSISIGNTFPDDNNAKKATEKAEAAEEKLKNVKENKLFNSDNSLKLFEIKSNLYSIISEKLGNEEGLIKQVSAAKENASNWMFINDVSIKNGVESNLFGRMNSGKVDVFDDCYLTTDIFKSKMGNAEDWANTLSSTMDNIMKFGEKLSGLETPGLIKTDSTVSLIGKGISSVAKGTKKVTDVASSVTGHLSKTNDNMKA